jgi:hypothetical protein
MVILIFGFGWKIGNRNLEGGYVYQIYNVFPTTSPGNPKKIIDLRISLSCGYNNQVVCRTSGSAPEFNRDKGFPNIFNQLFQEPAILEENIRGYSSHSDCYLRRDDGPKNKRREACRLAESGQVV